MITQKRFYYLDNLKILLTILVITHHVGLAYREAGGFLQNVNNQHLNIDWVGALYLINTGFFMGLFFMISGYFFPSSFDRKGGKEFLKDKLIRLGIPLVFVFFYYGPVRNVCLLHKL